MSLRHDERVGHWLTDVRRGDMAERVLGIAGGLLVVGFVGFMTTITVVFGW